MKETDRWRSVERLYHEALDRPRGERPAFLEGACAGDEALRREVESLLEHGEGSFLEEEALDMAARAVSLEGSLSLIGGRLGSYQVLSLVGAGGMGEVYRARDTTLGREVALKLLPREFSSDPERLSRLDREARLLASLNHPGIATLFGLEEADGRRLLVMELVPGPTLAERLRRGPLPLAEALAVGQQMAEVLEAAHERGVIHRDLKPANVKVTPDGRMKLLDFGLAKVLQASGSEIATTRAAEATREGTVLGTPAYMSPEQARGQPVDRRTDIWAFGCCLYESLCGNKAFGGSTMSDTLAAVLDREPDWGALPGATPDGVHRLLRRCLAKDVRRRLQHIGDARLVLEDTAEQPEERSAPARPRFRVRAPLLVAAALLLALALAFLGGWVSRATIETPLAARASREATRLTMRLEGEGGRDLQLSVGGFYVPFALSPDGTRLVFHARAPGAGGRRLFIRELSGFETRALPGTEGGATTPFFSPDGQWVGFWRASDHTLWKISVAGGPPVEIGPTEAPFNALWGPDGEILLETDRLWSIPAAGGRPQEIVVRDRSEGEDISLRSLIPGRPDLLVASSRSEGGDTWLEVLSRETGRRRRLLRGGRMVVARFTPSRHLVYADGDTLLAVPVDPKRLELLGPPVPVVQGIDHFYYHSNVALSDTGTVVSLPSDRVRKAELLWMDSSGRTSPVAGAESLDPHDSALSLNGRKAAVVLLEGSSLGVWIVDLERGSRQLLAPNGHAALFSRDGRFVSYWSNDQGKRVFFRRRADGAGDAETLFSLPKGWSTLDDWSPDGRSLLFSTFSSRGDSDIWIYADGKAAPLVASPFNEWWACFSPDGRFIAYDVEEAGNEIVYVQPFPGPGPRTPVSIGEGGGPRWARDGWLYYRGAGGMMVVRVETQPSLRVGTPQVLFKGDVPFVSYALAPDRRFLVQRPRLPVEGPLELDVILNWFAELERLVPHPARWPARVTSTPRRGRAARGSSSGSTRGSSRPARWRCRRSCSFPRGRGA